MLVYSFKWDDQTMVDFTNFGSQPANIESNCVTLVTNLTQPGKWFKTDCGEQHPVVCHIPNQGKKDASHKECSANLSKRHIKNRYCQRLFLMPCR